MKKRLLILFTLFFVLSVNAFTVDDIFTKLIYNTDSCIDNCKGVYEFCNPIDKDINLNSITHKFLGGKLKKEYPLMIEKIVNEEYNCIIGTYLEEVCNNYSDNDTLELITECYNVTVNDWGICNREVNKFIIMESDEEISYNKCVKLKISGSIGLNNAVDWIPEVKILGITYIQNKWEWWNSSYNFSYLLTVNASENQDLHFQCYNLSGKLNGSYRYLALLKNDSGVWNEETWWWEVERQGANLVAFNDSICWRLNLTANKNKNWYIYTSTTETVEYNSSGFLYKDSGELDATWTDATFISQESGGVDGDYFIRFSPTSETNDHMAFPTAYDSNDLYICLFVRLADDSRYPNMYHISDGDGIGTSENSIYLKINHDTSNVQIYDGSFYVIDNNYMSVWLPICFKEIDTTGGDVIISNITNSTHQIILDTIGSYGTVDQIGGFTFVVGGSGSATAQQDIDAFIILDGYDFNLYLEQPTIMIGVEEFEVTTTTTSTTTTINEDTTTTIREDLTGGIMRILFDDLTLAEHYICFYQRTNYTSNVTNTTKYRDNLILCFHPKSSYEYYHITVEDWNYKAILLGENIIYVVKVERLEKDIFSSPENLNQGLKSNIGYLISAFIILVLLGILLWKSRKGK